MPTVTPPTPIVDPKLSDEELAATALAIDAKDPAAVARSLNAIRDAAQQNRVSMHVVSVLTEREPVEALRVTMLLPGGWTQSSALEIVARAWVRRDVAAALQWAMCPLDAAIASPSRRAVAAELIRTDPRAGIARLNAFPPADARDELLIMAVAAWARQDDRAVEAWLRDLPESDLKPRMISSAGFEIAQRNPSRALALAETLPAGRNRWLLISAIGQTWVAVDRKAALNWANRLPAGEPRVAAFAGVDTGLGVPVARRPVGAPVAVRGSSRTRVSAGLAATWPELSSPDFAAWLATQPTGLSRDEAILEYVRQRGALDSGAIGAWLATLPGGPTRDRALEIYLEGQMIGSPQRATNWLRSLPRSDRTDELVEKAARRWLRTNPEDAEPWLLETPLPGYVKDRLLREAGR